jgi:hypothetical protein
MSLMNFISRMSASKLEIAEQPTPEDQTTSRESLLGKINEHYNTVLQYFDDAVQALHDLEAPSGPTSETPSRPPRNRSTISRLIDLQGDQVPRKRASEEDPNDQPEAKRGHDVPKTPPRPPAKVRTSVQGEVTVSSPLRRPVSNTDQDSD